MPEPRISSVLGGRERALIGVFVLVNVAVILAVVLLSSSGDDGGSKKKHAAPLFPRAGRIVVDRAIGARIRKPRGWSAKRGDRAISFRSPDSTTLMSISVEGVDNREVLRSAVAAIKQGYRNVAVARLRKPSGAACTPSTCKVAGLATVSRVLSATGKRVRLNILVSSPQGRRRAWLVEVFSGPGAPVKRLPEAQRALGTLRLSG